MFGRGRRIEQLEAELAQANGRLDQLEGALADLAGQTDLHQQLAAARRHVAEVARIHEQLAALRFESATRAAPQSRELGKVHLEATHGLVSLWFDGGLTDNLELLVGFDDPPSQLVGRLNNRNDLSSYLSTIIRPGERWIARSRRSSNTRSGIRCTFTPFG